MTGGEGCLHPLILRLRYRHRRIFDSTSQPTHPGFWHGGGMTERRGTPSRWSSPIEGPLRSCRLYRLYHPDHSTSAPAHTSRASARAAPAPTTLVTQGSHRRRGNRTPPLALSLGVIQGSRLGARPRRTCSICDSSRERRLDPYPHLAGWGLGAARREGVVCGGGWTAGRRRRR